jgi:hypothetical protein
MKKSKKKLLNTRIEALNEAHGQQIVDFYKSQGFDAGGFFGCNNRLDGDNRRYYGVKSNGDFESSFFGTDFTLLTLEEAKLLVQEKTYPRVMLVSNVNNIEAASQRVVFMEKNGYFLAWENAKTLEEAENELNIFNWDFAWELEEKTRFPFTLTPFNAQNILKIACNNWKETLAEKWAKDIVLNQNILIDEQFYKEMRNACTTPQNELFDEIFGKD